MIHSILVMLKNLSDDLAKNVGFQISVQGYPILLICQIVLTLLFFATFYTFRSVGLYCMAKKNGFAKPILAVVPFYGLYVAHTLAPKSKYIKGNTFFYKIAIACGGVYFVSTVLIDIIFAGEPLKLIFSGQPLSYESLNVYDSFYRILSAVTTLGELGYLLFSLLVYLDLYKAYSLKKSFAVWCILSYFFLDSILLCGIFIFALRNKQRIDYDAYISERARQAQRNYGQYGGQPPFGRPPYGGYNPYNGYGNGNSKPQEQQDPFEEFSSGSRGSTGNNSGDNTSVGGESDDLFD